MVIFENDFQKVNWGPDEAKGDRQLKKNTLLKSLNMKELKMVSIDIL